MSKFWQDYNTWNIFEFTLGASITVLFMAYTKWVGSL